MNAFLKLIRYQNLLMVALTMYLTKYALISTFLSSNNLSDLEFSILLFAVVCIAAGGYVVNDILDVKADAINKPQKVYVGNYISTKQSWLLFGGLTIIGICLGVYLSLQKGLRLHSLYFIITPIALIMYSKYLKRLPFLGNLCISFIIPLIMIIVYDFDYKTVGKSDIINSIFLSIILYYYLIFAFLSTLIREIIKDIEDIKGDYSLKMKTLPIVFGTLRARNIAIAITFLLLFFLFMLLIEAYNTDEYIFFVGIFTIALLASYILYQLWHAKKKKHFSQISSLLKVLMLMGILSMSLFIFE